MFCAFQGGKALLYCAGARINPAVLQLMPRARRVVEENNPLLDEIQKYYIED